MHKGHLNWLGLALAAILAATSLIALPHGQALAQKSKEVVTVEGMFDVLDGDVLQLSGTITAVEGTSDDFAVGDEVVVHVAPSGAFLPSALHEGDLVRVTGTLLGNGQTLKAAQFDVIESAGDDGENVDEDEDAECPAADPHPVGEKLAELFDVDYEQIMAWFCDGFGFGEIKLALRIAETAGVSVDELLARASDGEGWGEIILDLGLSPSDIAPGLALGHTKHAGPQDQPGAPDEPGPPGRPEEPGSQGQGRGQGPKK